MSLGKIHTYPGNARAYKALIAAKYNGVEVDVTDKFAFGVDNKDPSFTRKFPTAKVPAFEGNEGNLVESNAIAYYVAGIKADSQLMGRTHFENAQIMQYLFFCDNEIVPPAMRWMLPLLGYRPYDAEQVSRAKEELRAPLAVFDSMLSDKTFLVGDRVTLADIVCACNLLQLYKSFMDAPYRAEFVNVTRWFETCANQPNFRAVIGGFAFCKVAIAQPVAREEPAARCCGAKKPATTGAAPADDERDDDDLLVVKREKSKMDLLPKSSFNLDEWKKFYSNNSTRPTAVDYFWKNYDASGYSMWKFDYKYDSELTKVFMTRNLIGGMFQRMELLHKYAFGSMIIFGGENSLQVKGMFIFRGSEVPQEMKDVADFECYDVARVDEGDAKARELWNDYIAWDGHLEGLSFCDGKIFK